MRSSTVPIRVIEILTRSLICLAHLRLHCPGIQKLQKLYYVVAQHLNNGTIESYRVVFVDLIMVVYCFRRVSLANLHHSLRSEMWTWQLAESLLRDSLASEIRASEEEMEADGSHAVSIVEWSSVCI